VTSGGDQSLRPKINPSVIRPLRYYSDAPSVFFRTSLFHLEARPRNLDKN